METLFIATTLIVFICFTLAFAHTINKNTEVLQSIVNNTMKSSQNVPECNLHEEMKKEKPVVTKTTRPDEKYSGVLHIFVRNKIKHERPVMQYTYKDTIIYFEYDENNKPLNINGKQRKILESVIAGEKHRNFKKYEIKQS